MTKKEPQIEKTFVEVGCCETTSEWLDRIINDLADESKNFIDLALICN